jgi:hypothetical protein
MDLFNPEKEVNPNVTVSYNLKEGHVNISTPELAI